MSDPSWSARKELAIQRVVFAHRLTLTLLEDIAPAEWFQMPQGVTHIAWQVGHLAIAQFSLCLLRQRPETDDDRLLMPAEFRQKFGRGSQPVGDPAANPTPESIRAVSDAVFARVEEELPRYPAEDFAADALVPQPHPLFKSRLEALIWCAEHHMMHAGQIALLRRLLGKPPKW